MRGRPEKCQALCSSLGNGGVTLGGEVFCYSPRKRRSFRRGDPLNRVDLGPERQRWWHTQAGDRQRDRQAGRQAGGEPASWHMRECGAGTGTSDGVPAPGRPSQRSPAFGRFQTQVGGRRGPAGSPHGWALSRGLWGFAVKGQGRHGGGSLLLPWKGAAPTAGPGAPSLRLPCPVTEGTSAGTKPSSPPGVPEPLPPNVSFPRGSLKPSVTLLLPSSQPGSKPDEPPPASSQALGPPGAASLPPVASSAGCALGPQSVPRMQAALSPSLTPFCGTWPRHVFIPQLSFSPLCRTLPSWLRTTRSQQKLMTKA